jgi:hypothetical protein
LGAVPHYFFLDKKVTKNQVIRNASLPHRPYALQSRSNLGPGSFASCCRTGSHASGKITNARAAAQPHLFYRLSPEAARMTALDTNHDHPIFKHYIQSPLVARCWRCEKCGSKKASGEN